MQAALAGLRDAQVFALVPPAVRGLGQSSGFTLELQNSGGLSREEFQAARDKLLDAAAQDKSFVGVRPSDLPDVPTFHVDIDQHKLAVLGLNQSYVNNTMNAALGRRYVHDFITH